MNFGEKLKILRKSKGMSQEQLAAQITVSRQAISKWELGESLPDTENIIQLSKLFRVSIDYLLKDEFQSDNERPTENENSVPLKNIRHKKIPRITAIVTGSIGAVGLFVIWILSTMIKVPVTKSQVMPDGTITYYGGGDVLGYSFWAFISEYRLMAIFWTLLILLIAGIALLLMRFNKNGEETVG